MRRDGATASSAASPTGRTWSTRSRRRRPAAAECTRTSRSRTSSSSAPRWSADRAPRPGVNPALFISDLHLSPARQAIADRFLRFVGEEARSASALYILGDLFDRWLGDDAADDAFNRRQLDALHTLTGAGVPVRLMHGNRDFLFSASAAHRGGIELLADPSVRDLFGTRTLLMHGDLLCTDDVRYQRYRARVRRPGVIRTYLALPRAVRHAIGGGLSRVSETEKR